MNIDGITNGIVLDHIRAGGAMRIYEYLGLDRLESCVAVIQNVRSAKYGKKDIIKIDERIDLDLDALGYFDPNITVNCIREGKLIEKKCLEMPKQLVNVIKCKNPRCITSTEQEIPHKFVLADRKKKTYRCVYCDTLVRVK